MKKKKILKIIRYILQYFIAAVLLTTSIGKLLDIQGFAIVLDSYRFIPFQFAAPLGLTLSLAELALAMWLIWGRRLHLAALAAAALHLMFATSSAITLLRGIDLENCGCFGTFYARPLGWTTVIEDLVLVLFSLLLYRLAKRK